MSEKLTKVASEPTRMLIITFEGDDPTFEFSGHWAGKHVKTVSNLVARKYRWYQRDIKLQKGRN